MTDSWIRLLVPYLSKSLFINSADQLCSSGKIQLNPLQKHLVEKIIVGGSSLDDLVPAGASSPAGDEHAVKEKIRKTLLSYFRATDFIRTVELNLPTETDVIMVDRGWGGVYVHALDLWEKLNKKYNCRALLLAPEEPPYGFDARLQPLLITPRLWQGDKDELTSFVNIARTVLKKVPTRLLLFTHRIMTPYFFDIIKEIPTVIHADGYFEQCLRIGDHIAPEPPMGGLIEVLQELYYGNPNYVNNSSSLIHLKACTWSFKYAAENWFWCESQREAVMRDFSDMAEKFKLVLPLIDTQRFRPGKEAEKQNYILFTTTYGRSGIKDKGLHEILHAIRALPPEVKLKIVVHDENVLPASVRELRDRVEVLASVPKREMAKIYRRALANCRVSRDESSPVSILESMAAGLPVVVSPIVAGNIPVIEDGVTGFVVDPDDLDGLVKKLHLIISDPTTRQRMGRQARKRVLRYSMDNNIGKITRFFTSAPAKESASERRQGENQLSLDHQTEVG